MTVKSRAWEIVEAARPGDRASRAFDVFILTLIFLNVLAVMAGSIESVAMRHHRFLQLFEVASVVIFSVEYVLRLWSCGADSKYSGRIRGRIRFALTGMAIVDLAAILPFYLPFLGLDLRFLRVLRLLRIVRVAKVGRYYSPLKLIGDAVRSKREELVLSAAVMALLLVLSASAMYYCEHDAQPSAFSSIPGTLWWSVVTITTVGYGDVLPVTTLGKVFASVISILGIGMFALPTAILGAGFVEQFELRRRGGELRKCPHCGGQLG